MGPISIVVISFISAGIAIKLGYKIYRKIKKKRHPYILAEYDPSTEMKTLI